MVFCILTFFSTWHETLGPRSRSREDPANISIQEYIPKMKTKAILPTTIDKACNTPRSQYFGNLQTDRQWVAATGISREFFRVLLGLLDGKVKDNRSSSKEDKLLIVLVRLKTNITFSFMSTMFAIDCRTIADIFYQTLESLFHLARELLFWPSRGVIKARMPETFKSSYPNCRVIIDATEVAIPTPSDVRRSNLTWSDYKKKHILKFVVGKYNFNLYKCKTVCF